MSANKTVERFEEYVAKVWKLTPLNETSRLKYIPYYHLLLRQLHTPYVVIGLVVGTEDIFYLARKNTSFQGHITQAFSKPRRLHFSQKNKKPSVFHKNDFIWYWKVCTSDILQNMTDERAYFSEIMANGITWRLRRIFSAWFTWINCFVIIFECFHYWHIPKNDC